MTCQQAVGYPLPVDVWSARNQRGFKMIDLNRRMNEVAIAATAITNLSVRENESDMLLAHLLETTAVAESRRRIELRDVVRALCMAIVDDEYDDETLAEYVSGYYDAGQRKVKCGQSCNYVRGVKASERYSSMYS